MIMSRAALPPQQLQMNTEWTETESGISWQGGDAVTPLKIIRII